MKIRDVLDLTIIIVLILGVVLRFTAPEPETMTVEQMVELGVFNIAEMAKDSVYTVTGTVYNAVESQCDSDPLVTADGSIIRKDLVMSGDIRWIAVSRDLLGIFNYGDKVFVSGTDMFDGVWEVHDTMHSRFKNQIDFLVEDSRKHGKWEEIKITRI